jgi:transcriptional regulator with GAF, ATPase, and Fis domain
VRKVAGTDSTVLVTGETGTGKELIVRAIHALSRRKDKILVKVNCAALPGSLIESEIFGHEKGAFTGALTRKMGRFEVANGGTLFLDEIGDLPLELQAKPLRARTASSSGLADADAEGGRAADRGDESRPPAGGERRSLSRGLYYRLNVFPIVISALRERPKDISASPGISPCSTPRRWKARGRLSTEVLDQLSAYAWPGNVRELQNVIERAVILSPAGRFELGDMVAAPPRAGPKEKLRSIEDVERQHIAEVLEETRWRISGERGAAKILGLKRTTLEARMKKLGIRRP